MEIIKPRKIVDFEQDSVLGDICNGEKACVPIKKYCKRNGVYLNVTNETLQTDHTENKFILGVDEATKSKCFIASDLKNNSYFDSYIKVESNIENEREAIVDDKNERSKFSNSTSAKLAHLENTFHNQDDIKIEDLVPLKTTTSNGEESFVKQENQISVLKQNEMLYFERLTDSESDVETDGNVMLEKYLSYKTQSDLNDVQLNNNSDKEDKGRKYISDIILSESDSDESLFSLNNEITEDNNTKLTNKAESCPNYLVINQKDKAYVNDDVKHRKYQCCMCSKRFKLKHHLNQHIITHTYERDKVKRCHKCMTCSKSFKMKHHLERHLLTHTKEKRYKCALCEKSYVDKYDLIKHMKIHGPKTRTVKPKLFNCNICGAKFNTKVEYQIHAHSHDIACDICGKKFLQIKYLKNHLRVHAKSAPVSCEFCGKLFSFKAILTEHERLHTGQKPYECEVCNKTFTTKSNQLRHEKSHFLTYCCKYCLQKFVGKEQFQQHVRTCTSKYWCERCKRSFNKSSNYKNHMETHTKYLNSDLQSSNVISECITIEDAN